MEQHEVCVRVWISYPTIDDDDKKQESFLEDNGVGSNVYWYWAYH
jgi:hypothetical protein